MSMAETTAMRPRFAWRAWRRVIAPGNTRTLRVSAKWWTRPFFPLGNPLTVRAEGPFPG